MAGVLLLVGALGVGGLSYCCWKQRKSSLPQPSVPKVSGSDFIQWTQKSLPRKPIPHEIGLTGFIVVSPEISPGYYWDLDAKGRFIAAVGNFIVFQKFNQEGTLLWREVEPGHGWNQTAENDLRIWRGKAEGFLKSRKNRRKK